ncbi:uncharacterized protein LOC130676979 [Microplitis mediator]|uniref:uncharacterized protein LOC130676979 n=1 Tax=Microplitis mediator TaxID=375433 RepID=UPI002556B6BE|nr:uncharacterized protein LOC130676979 [Microplitis mediator]
MVVLTRQRWFESHFCVSTNDVDITAKRAIRYLGFELDDKLSFRDNLRKTTGKAGKTVSNLAKLMFNTAGPKYETRRILLSVVHSILRYGAEVRADKTRIKTFRSKLTSVQRKAALRVACAYRTVSEAAILVLAKATPMDLMAQERRRIHQRRQDGSLDSNAVKAEKRRTLNEWNHRWQNCTRRQSGEPEPVK